ncbi:glycosyltransferase, partial [Candidatus Microgenomates bacterium]|nr:glycosyltransferase [Candidatus Microgenomates bacterium]
MYQRLPDDQKIALIKQVLNREKSVSQACRETDISRTIFYRWLRSFKSSQSPKSAKISSRQTPPEKEKAVLDFVLRHPEYSSQRISQVLGVNRKGRLILGNHGVQNVLSRHSLNTYEDRLAFGKKQQEQSEALWQQGRTLNSAQRLQMIKRVVENKEKVSQICQEFGISRFTFYRWLNRYLQAPKGLEAQALGDQERVAKNYGRQVPTEWEQKILELVLENPSYSIRQILASLPQNEFGGPVIGHYGVQRVLERNNLNTYQRRLTYQQSQRQSAASAFPNVAPEPQIFTSPKILRFLKAPFATVPKLFPLFRLFLTNFILSLLISSAFFQYKELFSFQFTPGIFFALISLTFGLFFFLYSLKYYFTLILVLGFSRQVHERGDEIGEKPAGGILKRLFGMKENGDWQSDLAPANIGNGHSNGKNGDLRGLQPDLSRVELERKPFVSIHLPMYNEKRVVDRLLSACTLMEYENFEVVVIDDSTDETTRLLEKWASHPKVKVIHRESREGYKGGALKEALKVTDPQAEFILVFDADFLPYPDTITQFLKYFQLSSGSLDAISSSNIAAIQGYQWHVLNKSENWITRGVRSEYAGSYVIERSGGEIMGALKQ